MTAQSFACVESLTLVEVARILGVTTSRARQLGHSGALGELSWGPGPSGRPAYRVASRGLLQYVINEGELLVGLQDRLLLVADRLSSSSELEESLRAAVEVIAQRCGDLYDALQAAQVVPPADGTGMTPVSRSRRAKP